ncbi:hypothetical protein MMC24_006932 [Lignoscripta atroalba]|nr:hypothetical protein [Lignoscripta atroalba]
MPSHLHPRSRLTTSLFGTTLLVSFLVVGMPHIFPCPAPRTEFADVEMSEDGQGRQRRRRRRKPSLDTDPTTTTTTTPTSNLPLPGGSEKGQQQQQQQQQVEQPTSLDVLDEHELSRARAHECPVPKPRGLVAIAEALGFKGGEEKQSSTASESMEGGTLELERRRRPREGG